MFDWIVMGCETGQFGRVVSLKCSNCLEYNSCAEDGAMPECDCRREQRKSAPERNVEETVSL